MRTAVYIFFWHSAMSEATFAGAYHRQRWREAQSQTAEKAEQGGHGFSAAFGAAPSNPEGALQNATEPSARA